MIEFSICNNNERGILTTEVFMIQLILDDDIALQLESANIHAQGEKLIFADNRVIFKNGCRVKYETFHEWTGNIRWNTYTFQDAYALGFLYLLQQSREWNVTEGYDELFDKWVNGKEILPEDLGLLPDAVSKLYIDPLQTTLA